MKTLAAIAILVAASQAAAQGADVTAAVDLTEGAPSGSAYVPVRLQVTNRTDFIFEKVRVDSGGPVQTVAPWHIAPAATEERTMPVFFSGAPLTFTAEFFAGGRAVACTEVGPVEVTGASAFQQAAQAVIQPKAFDLFADEVWPMADRRRLWLWLGVLSLAVLVFGLLVPRRRVLAATAVVVFLAAAGTAFPWFFGGVRQARLVEARVFYAEPDLARATVERFVWMASRGGKAACARLTLDEQGRLPAPLLHTSGDLFRPQGVLHLGDSPSFESRCPLVVLNILERSELPFIAGGLDLMREDLPALAHRADVVKALLVEGNRGADACGVTQPTEAWAADWKRSADPAVAHAGRSLGWWRSERQEGDGPWLVAWFHDEAPSAGAAKRTPAMLVYRLNR